MRRAIWIFCLGLAVPADALERTNVRNCLTIQAGAPPMLMYVQDSHGRRSGADPTRTMTGEGLGAEITEIPGSQVDADNMATDEPGTPDDPAAHTSWMIQIFDPGVQDFVVHLRGVATGLGSVNFTGSRNSSTLSGGTTEIIGRESADFPMAPGVERRVMVHFDPEAGTVNVRRIAGGADVEGVLRNACALGIIPSSGLCRSLAAKLKQVLKAEAKGQWRTARNALRAFTSELKAQSGKKIRQEIVELIMLDVAALDKSLSEQMSAVGMKQASNRRK